MLYYKRTDTAGGSRADGIISLGHILQFCTGEDSEPVLGFQLDPSIVFKEADNDFLPTANTCSNCLYLPIPSLTKPLPDKTKLYNLYDYAFANNYFGRV